RNLGKPARDVERERVGKPLAQEGDLATDGGGVTAPNRTRERVRKAEPFDVLGDAAKERPEHLRGVFAGGPGGDEQLDAARRERRSAVRDQPGGGVIADGVETVERARRHPELLRERSSPLLRDGLAFHVDVAAREGGEKLP